MSPERVHQDLSQLDGKRPGLVYLPAAVWGHQIPAWTCADYGHMTVSRQDAQVCEACGSARIERDPDVLDTWFSSALWPFETLGWPEQTQDLADFYPTDVLVTGYDIISSGWPG